MAAIVIALALAAAPLGWIARRFVYRDMGETTPEPIAPCPCRRLDICDLRRTAARRPRRAGRRARLLRSLRSEHAGGHRRRVRGGARADRRQCAWPRHARAGAPGLEARSDQRSAAGILYRLAMTFAAIWAVERLVEPAADAAASLNIAVAARGVGAVVAAIAIAYRAAPARIAADGRARIAAKRRLDPLRTLGWAAALIIFLAAADRLCRLRHFPAQSGDLPQHSRQSPLHCRYHRPGRNRSRLEAGWADWRAPDGHGGAAPQCARADLRHPARPRPCGGACGCRRGGAEALGRAVAGHVRLAALGLFRLLASAASPCRCRR